MGRNADDVDGAAWGRGGHRRRLLPFVNISGTVVDDWYRAGIVETLAVSLEEAGVPVVRVEVAPGADDAAAYGSRSARWFVTGSYQRQGTEIRIAARVVEVATRAVVQTSIVDGPALELFSPQDRLVADLGLSLSVVDGQAVSQPDRDDRRREPAAFCAGSHSAASWSTFS